MGASAGGLRLPVQCVYLHKSHSVTLHHPLNRDAIVQQQLIKQLGILLGIYLLVDHRIKRREAEVVNECLGIPSMN